MASAQEQPLEFTQGCVFTLRQSVGPVKHLEIACVFNCFMLYSNQILATARQKYLTNVFFNNKKPFLLLNSFQFFKNSKSKYVDEI